MGAYCKITFYFICVGIVYFNAAITKEKLKKKTTTPKTNTQKFFLATYFFVKITPKIKNAIAKTANITIITIINQALFHFAY